jgi:hypothetical protein
MEKENCYRFEKKTYNSGLLDDTVDATYIIHLEGNGRLPNIENQLKQFQPSKTVYIVYNKGFKNCKKDLYLQTAAVDLTHAFVSVFKHAKIQEYQNILILEDDFFFSEEIKKIEVRQDIKHFVLKKTEKREEFMYYLGCIPFLQSPSLFQNHSRVFLSCGTHSAIYSKELRERVLYEKLNIYDWDLYNNYYTKRYMYYKAICYQLFPDTENSKEWGKNFYNTGSLLSFVFKSVHLDQKVDPGYHYFYIFSKMQFFFYLILFSILFYLLFKKIFLSKNSSKKKK